MNLKTAPTPHTQEILDAIRRIIRALRVSSCTAEKEFGLSSAQLFVLQKLKESQSLSLNELAERTFTHQSSVSVVVRKLVDRGLAESYKSDLDARRVEISITTKGNNLIKKAPGAFQDKLILAIESLTTENRLNLAKCLSKIVKDTGNELGPAPLVFEDTD